MAAVAEALEESRVDSHLHPEGSFEVADHIVPTGREEIWRFTPLKRMRKLHADAEFGPTTIKSTWNAPDGVRVEQVEGEEARGLRGISGLVPNTLFGARVLAEVPTTLLVDVPAEAEIAEPIVVELDGGSAEQTEAGHVALRFGNHARAVVVLNHTGHASLAQVVEVSVGDGAEVSVISLQDGADGRQRPVRRPRRRGRDARPLLRRRGAAHRTPAVHRPHRSADQEPRRLQGRTPG
jgi:Fe-S cluster assembly protein SufD